MFCTNIMMIQATSFIYCQLNHLFGLWRQADLTEHDAISTANNKFDGAANFVQFNTEIRQYFRSHTFAFAYETQQEVFCTDVVVLEALRLFLSKIQNFPASLCELIKPVPIRGRRWSWGRKLRSI